MRSENQFRNAKQERAIYSALTDRKPLGPALSEWSLNLTVFDINSKEGMRMKPIATVGVVGAGTMGSAIAQHFVMKGLSVILVDQ